MAESCPTVERLNILLRGLERADDDAAIMAHVADCPACQARLEMSAGGSGWLEAKAKTHADSGDISSKPLSEAMAALESRLGLSDGVSPPPKLDFLRPSDQPGRLGSFGSYEIITHVASGGMGIVLKAQDPALKRIVALKILPPMLAANPLARARFVREARAAAAVVHEHVVPIYAVDECAGLPYIVMQFVQGRSLAERIRATGPLQLEEILRIGAQTAAGLAAAHAQGLVHRDVKPGNILLENSVERVKLTDFGLARAVDDAGLTRTGELAGTPEFMSPEQANNEAVDHRSDLFSLGSVLYAMATGHSPFAANSMIAVVRKVCDEHPPAPHSANSNVPDWLSAIIARLMAKNPAERFQTAIEVHALLERYLARVQQGECGELTEAVEARRQATLRSLGRRLAWGAAIVLLITGLLGFGLKLWPSANHVAETSAPSPAFVVSDAKDQILGSYATADEAISNAPVAAVIDLCWNGPLLVKPLDLGQKRLGLRAGKGFHPVWECNGEGSPAIQTQAGLTLENLEFQVRGNRGGRPGRPQPSQGVLAPGASQRRAFETPEVAGEAECVLVSIHRASLRISHCFFHRQLARPADMQRLTFIELDNSPTCVISDSAFNAIVGRCLVWHQDHAASAMATTATATCATALVASNSAFYGVSAIQLELGAGVRACSELTRCTFRGRTALDISSGFAATNLSVLACNNLVATGSFLFDDRVSPAIPFAAWLDWTGRTNFFNVFHGFLAARERTREISNHLDEWAQPWGSKVTDSMSGEVTFAAEQSHPGSPLGRAQQLRIFEVTDLTVLEGPPLARAQWASIGADIRNLGPELR